MKRLAIGMVLAVFLIGSLSAVAEARGKKKGKKAKKEGATPNSEAIAPALGDIKWGMTKKQLQKLLFTKLNEEYKPLIGKTRDGMEEDRLRQELEGKRRKIRESFVSFDGQSTGYDLGFLRDEFTHNNGESLLVYKDSNSQNFYFFINDRLWKLYKALDIGLFEGRDFNQFASVVKKKFGEAKDEKGPLVEGGDPRHWLQWQDKKTRLRAVDLTDFYGFYCLIFEEKKTLDNLASIRTNKRQRRAKTHALVDSVTSVNQTSTSPDVAPNIVDRITGKIRVREDAPDEKSEKGKKSKSSSSSSSSSGQDPFADLDF